MDMHSSPSCDKHKARRKWRKIQQPLCVFCVRMYIIYMSVCVCMQIISLQCRHWGEGLELGNVVLVGSMGSPLGTSSLPVDVYNSIQRHEFINVLIWSSPQFTPSKVILRMIKLKHALLAHLEVSTSIWSVRRAENGYLPGIKVSVIRNGHQKSLNRLFLKSLKLHSQRSSRRGAR